MIFDALQCFSRYPWGRIDQPLRDFLLSLGDAVPDGEYPIMGRDIFARVMTYETRNRESAVLEAHRDYIDIQVVFSGAEILEWYPLQDLATARQYDPESDAEFYVKPSESPGSLFLVPEVFAVLFPRDGHSTQILISKPEVVRKAVVKVRTNMLEW
ncbi:MAG: YhcH/YjgK/YiaL family protein [Syntrophobacteraceae bacterium]